MAPKSSSRTVTSNKPVEASFPALDPREVFNSIDAKGRGYLTDRQFWRMMENAGLAANDPRLESLNTYLDNLVEPSDSETKILPEHFEEIVQQNALVRNVLTGDLVIPDFPAFTADLSQLFEHCRANRGGEVATYIPQLARVHPEKYALSVCTIDGQRFSQGDVSDRFCLQSTCKPINYALALESQGEQVVHKHVGREPSGREFNELSLNKDNLPHNPMINAGAIMCCSLLNPEQTPADRFDYVLNTWERLACERPNFNNSVYLSERRTADRNFALAYFMRENNAFPKGVDILNVLEFYFQCCSIELTAEGMAIAAATLANAGVNPVTEERIFTPKTVQNCLSLMYSCGMYDFSGEFAFKIGLPAKSGVSGALMVVVPNVAGFCIWSPRLDRHGNSVRGVQFCERLVETYNFHNYDSLVAEHNKKDPRRQKFESQASNITALIYAATFGDLEEIKRLHAAGLDLNETDYDGRTALHLAAAEGHTRVVKYLLRKNVDPNMRDRWGNTAHVDAKRGKNKEVIELLQQWESSNKNAAR